MLDESQCQWLNDQLASEAGGRRARERRRGRLLGDDLSLGWRTSAPQEIRPGPQTPVVDLEQARFYLDCGEFEQALSILLPLRNGQTFCDPECTLDLLDRAYGQIGDTAQRIEVRRERFFARPNLKNYRRLAQLLDLPALEALRKEIATKSLATADVVTRARVLFAADLPLLAQNLVLASASTFETEGPTYRLAHLAAEAYEHGYPLAAAVIWRGVVNSILQSGKTRDYRIGGRILGELQDLSAEIDDYREFPSHLEYEAELYDRHCLKKQFWRRIERMRPD